MISNLLKSILGDKSAKDRKQFQPIIDQANSFFQQYKSISDDELRQKTQEFRKQIQEGTQALEAELIELKAKASDLNIPVQEKEALFEQIDKQTKAIDDKIEEILDQILPQAFGVVKETARRWKENGQLKVTAQDFDRDLAASQIG